MENIKHPGVAGKFYPENPTELKAMIQGFLDNAKKTVFPPKALVAPHAGYIYSGPVAAHAFKSLLQVEAKMENLIILAPTHRNAPAGISTHSADMFKTPVGSLMVNHEIIDQIKKFPQVNECNEAFNDEHTLEVQLPFLAHMFPKLNIVPLVVGSSSPDEIAEVIESLWDRQENIFLISSDLSHFHEYDNANQIDKITTSSILNCDYTNISAEQACGYYPLRGLLKVVKEKGLKSHLLQQNNSGDIGGDKSSVVGYGSYLFEESI